MTLDGLRDEGYRLLAQDPAGDLSPAFSTDTAKSWADLTDLSVATDTTHLWVYVDLPNYTSHSVGEFGLAIDADGAASSGGTQDPWGNGITFTYTSTYNNVDTTPITASHVLLPDVVIRGSLFSVDAGGGGRTELRTWNGSAWAGDGVNWGEVTTSSVGANIAFLYGHGIEFSIPFSDLGVPPTTTLSLEFYATGANGIGQFSGAWDTVPSDAQSDVQYRPTTQHRLATLGPPAILPLVSFSAASYSASEADGTAPITITVAPTSTSLISFTLITTDGTAGPADYVAISETFTMTPGSAARVVALHILADALAEPDETVLLGLSHPANAQLGQPLTATLIIHDSPPLSVHNSLFMPLLRR
jgi:Calx-beta domain